MPQNSINRIVQDSRGFIWFCTGQGISRFDGYSFKNFGLDEGMPDRRVQDLIETRSGEFCLATYGGLVRFNPRGQTTNQVIKVNELSLAPQTASQPMFTT